MAKSFKSHEKGLQEDHSTQGGIYEPSEVKPISEQINVML